MKEKLPDILPKSSIGQAIKYTLRLWPRLTRFIRNGQVEIDNNLIENSIRPVALGRKNYLFAGSHEAAQQEAMMYSFLGTCKINGVEPFGWLKDVLKRIPDHSIQKLDELYLVKRFYKNHSRKNKWHQTESSRPSIHYPIELDGWIFIFITGFYSDLRME